MPWPLELSTSVECQSWVTERGRDSAFLWADTKAFPPMGTEGSWSTMFSFLITEGL